MPWPRIDPRGPLMSFADTPLTVGLEAFSADREGDFSCFPSRNELIVLRTSQITVFHRNFTFPLFSSTASRRNRASAPISMRFFASYGQHFSMASTNLPSANEFVRHRGSICDVFFLMISFFRSGVFKSGKGPTPVSKPKKLLPRENISIFSSSGLSKYSSAERH